VIAIKRNRLCCNQHLSFARTNTVQNDSILSPRGETRIANTGGSKGHTWSYTVKFRQSSSLPGYKVVNFDRIFPRSPRDNFYCFIFSRIHELLSCFRSFERPRIIRLLASEVPVRPWVQGGNNTCAFI